MRQKLRSIITIFAGFFLLAAFARPAKAVELKKETVAAYERYLRAREADNEARRNRGRNFLGVDDSPQRIKQVRSAEILVEPINGDGQIEVPGGLIHDWIGAVFIPGATILTVFAVVHDYNNFKNYYKPTVIDSKDFGDNGSDHTFYLRLKKKAIVTAVIDSLYSTRYSPLDQNRWYGREKSTRIAEVENAGEPNERELPVGQGHGYIWRLDAFTRFQQRDGGVYVELEAIALTRDIPSYIAWLVQPIVRRLSRGSLHTTLSDTRHAVLKQKWQVTSDE